MKKLIVAAMAVAFAGTAVPTVASAAMLVVRDNHHHRHCRIVHKRERHHGHWVVRSVRVCR